MTLFWRERAWAEEGWLAGAIIVKVSAAVDVEPLTVYWIFYFLFSLSVWQIEMMMIVGMRE